MEVGACFMPQTHPRGSQRPERRWHRKIEQQLKKIGEELGHRHRVGSLLNALSLRDKALSHASKSGDHQERNARDAPTQIASATLEMPPRDTEARNRDHRGNHVAAPVHDVQDRSLDRGSLLALHGLAELWRCTQVLSGRYEWSGKIAGENNPKREQQRNACPIDSAGAFIR